MDSLTNILFLLENYSKYFDDLDLYRSLDLYPFGFISVIV